MSNAMDKLQQQGNEIFNPLAERLLVALSSLTAPQLPPPEDIAINLCLMSIDQTRELRKMVVTAAEQMDAGNAEAARTTLQQALDATDVGTMKEWQPGEEPF